MNRKEKLHTCHTHIHVSIHIKFPVGGILYFCLMVVKLASLFANKLAYILTKLAVWKLAPVAKPVQMWLVVS